MSAGSIHRCAHCHQKHPSHISAAMCCLFAPKPTGWCAWCGKDCKGTFCCRPCAVGYRNDVIAARSRDSARGWCAWCGNDCVGEFCTKRCEKDYQRDKSRAA